MTYLNWLTDDVIDQLRAAETAPDGTVTMMFTDIVSSTAIKRELGDTDAKRDAAWVETFQTPHHALVRAAIAAYEGFEVKTIGDAFFVTFVDPANAVRCAVAIQRDLAKANLITPLPERPPLQIRIGIHTGTPILQGVDYVGTAVDKAARVEGAAEGGGVLISEQTRALLHGQLSDLAFHRCGAFLLKGLGGEPHTLFEVLWDSKSPTPLSLPEFTATKPHSILRPDPLFVGRQAECAEIADVLNPQSDSGYQVVVLHAAGGMGKTALARQVVFDIAAQFDAGVLVATARTYTPADPIHRLVDAGKVKPIADDLDFLTQVGRQLEMKLTGSEDPDKLISTLINTLDDGRGRLLFLDNLDDISQSEYLHDFLEMLPQTSRALITSRTDLPFFSTKRSIPVPPLPLAAAIEMMESFGKRLRFTPTKVQMKRLHELTGGNPLAIKLAIHAVAEVRTTFDTFLDNLASGGGKATDLFKYLFDYALSVGGDTVKRIFKAMSLFVTHARRDALQAVCAFDAEAIFDKAVASAVRLSLVDWDAASEQLTMQELARYYAARLLQEGAEEEAFQKRFTAWYADFVRMGESLNPELTQQNAWEQLGDGATPEAVNEAAHRIRIGILDKLDVEWVNAFRALTYAIAAGDLAAAMGIYDGLGDFLNMRSYWSDRAQGLQFILVAQRAAPDADTPEGQHQIGVSLHNVGTVYKLQGRWSEAEEVYQQSLAICQELSDRHGRGQTLNNLGTVYRLQGRWSEAEAAYQQSLAICQELGDRYRQGQTLNNLGNVCQSQGRWSEAEEVYQQSLGIKQELGDRHGQGLTLGNLGTVYKLQGRWSEAEAAYQQSLDIFSELGDHHGEGQILNNLGNVYRSQSRWSEAKAAYQRNLDICQELGDRHGQGQTLGNLALLRAAQGDIVGALDFAQESLAVFESTEDQAALEKARGIVAWLEAVLREASNP